MTNNESPGAQGLPTIIVDTREQRPHHILDGQRCNYLEHGLLIGDYALADDCRTQDGKRTLYDPAFAVERKSIPDLVSTVMLSRNWSREMRNNVGPARERGFNLQYFIDGNEHDLAAYDFSRFLNAEITWRTVLARLDVLERDEGVRFRFHVNRQCAEWRIVGVLKRRQEFLQKAARQARRRNAFMAKVAASQGGNE